MQHADIILSRTEKKWAKRKIDGEEKRETFNKHIQIHR